MTELEICNWALLKLGQRPLGSFNEASFKAASLCRPLFPPLHRSLLRSFAWSFATQSAYLSPLAPTNGKELHYPLPKGCLKVLKVEGDGALRGDRLISRERSSEPIMIEYIADISVSDCDPLFQEALACKLASELCPTLTADSQLTLRLKAEFEEAKKTAIDMDGIEISEPRKY